MLLLRDAQRSDLPGLRRLAAVLDSVNLPDDARALGEIVDRSIASFTGRIRDPLRRAYVFVAEDLERGRLVGTSMVIAQHGTRASPCTFFNVLEREHYSSSLDRHFRHRILSLGYHFDGPTEIGGLVVHPGSRGEPWKPGKQLAYVRFLYMAMHPERFRETVLAELMAPLSRDGRSVFWEAFGRRFTGLDYQTADKLSRQNKEFIQQLFPPFDVYVSLLPPKVQKVLGAVGPRTRPIQGMLERLGFRPVGRIDPVDGGPHYEARLADVSLVRGYRAARLLPTPLAGAAPEALVAL
ncbi:MAG TPA: arginine N-succinyltransferase, partial [Anaeromyxobacteraceae bacterium]|nr:arginine N-succinyltransferase [Anaeromyxobacteraceae bacterium]